MAELPLSYINALYLSAVTRQRAERLAKEKAEKEGKKPPTSEYAINEAIEELEDSI